MLPTTTLEYQLGVLESKYTIETQSSSLSQDFSIYSTIDASPTNDSAFLRRLAKQRGYIDGLKHVLTTKTAHVPLRLDWVSDNPAQTLRNVQQTLSDTTYQNSRSTWTTYCIGWRDALRYALNDTL